MFVTMAKIKTCNLDQFLSSLSFLSQIADLANEDTPQLYVACGRGPKSSMRVLRHGLEVILLIKSVYFLKICTMLLTRNS